MKIDQELQQPLTADQVEAYLKSNPSFFLERKNLLMELFLPHESGEAISLVERQVSLLRERNIESRKKINQFMVKAQDNDALFAKTQAIILSLMDETSIQSLLYSFKQNCQTHFAVEAVQFMFFKPELATMHEFSQYAFDDAQNKLPWLKNVTKSVSGHFREEEIHFVFKNEQPLHSCLFIPLKQNDNLIGLVAFGSTDAQHFFANMDTLFIDFIINALNKQLLTLAS